MQVKWIEHKGKKILYSDFSGMKTNELLFSTLDEAVSQFITAQDKVRHLLDFTNASLTTDFMNKAKEEGKKLPQGKSEKDAYLGITGVKKVLLNGYLWVTKEPAQVFEDKEKALDWLAEDK